LKQPFTKKAGGMAQGVGPEFKPQFQKTKKKSDLSFLFFLVGVGFEFRALHLHSRHSSPLRHTSSPLSSAYLEMGYRELFLMAGLIPPYLSLPSN
jgi:hypothetical protein